MRLSSVGDSWHWVIDAMRLLNRFIIPGLALLLSACMTPTGRDFQRADKAEILPGRSTEADIRRQFGDPLEVKRFTTPQGVEGGGNVEGSPFEVAGVEGNYALLIYVFSENVNAAGWRGSREYYQRTAVFLFWDGVLIDYNISSSFPEDSTAFEAARLQDIEKGKSIEAQVVSLLGQPSGVAIYPAVRDPGARLLHYGHGVVRVGLFISDQTLTSRTADVLIGPDGRTVDYRYQSTDQSPKGDRPQ